MCGRYSLTTPAEALARLFKTSGPLPNLPARYNVAPSQDCAVVRLAASGTRELALLRWGLIPSWSPEPGLKYSTINARAETVAVKPAYRAAFRSRRCLVPADGFYEWRASAKRKQPFFIRLKSRTPFAFAGLWERWEKEADVIQSFAIVVTEANEMMRGIHARMPVILTPEDHAAWLDAGTPAAQAQAMLRPYDGAAMEAYPVSTRVNSPRNDDPACLAPAS